MNLQQITDAVILYKSLLQDKGSAQEYIAHDEHPDDAEILNHCLWMCDQILADMDRDKAMRWLCFIQGCLWTSGERTILEMRF